MEKVLLKIGPKKGDILSVEFLAVFQKEEHLGYKVRVSVGQNKEDFDISFDDVKEFKRRLNVLGNYSKESLKLDPSQIEWLFKMLDATPLKHEKMKIEIEKEPEPEPEQREPEIKDPKPPSPEEKS